MRTSNRDDGLPLLQSAAEGRALEVLLAAIEHGRLLPAALGTALGHLLTHEYAPVPRLADTLTQVRGLGSRPDDALHQLLDALLPALPAAPPRQTAGLLAAYADLLATARAAHRASPPARVEHLGHPQKAGCSAVVGQLVAKPRQPVPDPEVSGTQDGN